MRIQSIFDRTKTARETERKARWEAPRVTQFNAAEAEGTPGISTDSPVTTS